MHPKLRARVDIAQAAIDAIANETDGITPEEIAEALGEVEEHVEAAISGVGLDDDDDPPDFDDLADENDDDDLDDLDDDDDNWLHLSRLRTRLDYDD